jgi:hypothetical protein
VLLFQPFTFLVIAGFAWVLVFVVHQIGHHSGHQLTTKTNCTESVMARELSGRKKKQPPSAFSGQNGTFRSSA